MRPVCVEIGDVRYSIGSNPISPFPTLSLPLPSLSPILSYPILPSLPLLPSILGFQSVRPVCVEVGDVRYSIGSVRQVGDLPAPSPYMSSLCISPLPIFLITQPTLCAR